MRSTILSPDSNARSRPVRSGRACDAIVVDVHCAEATSEKNAIGHVFDGRASLIVGTHTHVPTADHRILAGGTAYMSDAGMTGDYDSVIGVEKDEPIRRFIRKTPGSRYEPANGPATLCGVAVETDDQDGAGRQGRPGADRRAAQPGRAGFLGLRRFRLRLPDRARVSSPRPRLSSAVVASAAKQPKSLLPQLCLELFSSSMRHTSGSCLSVAKT